VIPAVASYRAVHAFLTRHVSSTRVSLFRSVRWMFSGRRLRARVRRAGFVALASAPEGTPVAIRGTIRVDDSAGPLLDAPLSGAQCVYHASCIDLDVVGTFTMKPHARETRARRFILECENGEHAIVEPDHLVVAARFDYVAASMASFDATPRQRALLDTAPVTSWFAIRGVHYYEAVLVPGQSIALLGAGTRELAGTGESGYREAHTRMHFSGTPKHPLVLCDYPDQL
jgi:hypothetical protein